MRTERSPIFRNKPPEIDQSERAILNRLLDLEEIARFVADGEKVTIDFLLSRVFSRIKAESYESRVRGADRRVRLLFTEAKHLGFKMAFEPDPELADSSQQGRWIVVVDDVGGLLGVLGEKISDLTEDPDDASLTLLPFITGPPGRLTGRALKEKMVRSDLVRSGLCLRCKKPAASGRVHCERCLAAGRERDAQRRELGLCTDCGREPAARDLTVCKKCHARWRRRYDALKEAGLCTQCHDLARPGKTLCEACYDTRRQQYDRLVESGVCVTCKTRPSSKGFVQCDGCLKARTDLYRQRAEKGRCPLCGGKRSGDTTLCEECLSKRRAWTTSRAEQGFCTSCRARPAREGASTCAECAEKNKQRHRSLVDAGLCTECGEKPAAPGRHRCEECLKGLTEYSTKKREQRAAEGKCLTCESAAEPGFAKCRSCLDATTEKTRDYFAQRRAERKAKGICEKCDSPIAPDSKTMCRKHLEASRAKAKARREARKVSGRCVSCDEPLPEGWETTRCRLCSERRSGETASYHEARAAGLCTYCKEVPAARAGLCATCYPKVRGRAGEIRAERREGGLCACGEPVRPGKRTCEKCATAASIASKARREELKAKGICYACRSGKPGPGHTLCDECIADQKDRYERWRDRRGSKDAS